MKAQRQLERILKRHLEWVASKGKKGKKVNIQGVRFQNVSLPGAELRNACLQDVDLK